MSYFCIGLDNPKFDSNIGGVYRAAQAFGVSLIVVSKRRGKLKRYSTDTGKYYKHIPVMNITNLHDAIPFDCIPIAVDIIEGATSIVNYKHPKRAFYIFGAEDATLGKKITDWCKDVIYIPSSICLNLAACVNVVLYDRMSKGMKPVSYKGDSYG